MDLHDFADVAQNYDLYLPSLGTDTDGFEDFYLTLSSQYGGKGVLDIACGTGALTLPLAAAGHDVSAFDLSEPMVEITRDKLSARGLSAEVFAADMTSFHAGRLFSLAIIARSGFMHLLTPRSQRSALLCVREHLCNGGILTLNTFQPHPHSQAKQMDEGDYTLRAEYINKEGKRERIYNSISYDYMTQIMSGSWRFDTLDEQGNVTDTRVRPLAMRQSYRQELEYLFELCGYEVRDVYGNYKRSTTGGNFIWILKKR
ncbi:MAG: class I SAM-dependent methyltransferase [Eubacteriales bacterium]